MNKDLKTTKRRKRQTKKADQLQKVRGTRAPVQNVQQQVRVTVSRPREQQKQQQQPFQYPMYFPPQAPQYQTQQRMDLTPIKDMQKEFLNELGKQREEHRQAMQSMREQGRQDPRLVVPVHDIQQVREEQATSANMIASILEDQQRQAQEQQKQAQEQRQMIRQIGEKQQGIEWTLGSLSQQQQKQYEEQTKAAELIASTLENQRALRQQQQEEIQQIKEVSEYGMETLEGRLKEQQKQIAAQEEKQQQMEGAKLGMLQTRLNDFMQTLEDRFGQMTTQQQGMAQKMEKDFGRYEQQLNKLEEEKTQILQRLEMAQSAKDIKEIRALLDKNQTEINQQISAITTELGDAQSRLSSIGAQVRSMEPREPEEAMKAKTSTEVEKPAEPKGKEKVTVPMIEEMKTSFKEEKNKAIDDLFSFKKEIKKPITEERKNEILLALETLNDAGYYTTKRNKEAYSKIITELNPEKK